MKCALCNSNLVSKSGEIDFNTRSLGKVFVPNLKYLECKGCGEKLLTPKESDKVTEYLTNREQEQINKLSIAEFITANQAAEILKITKQAFSKHPRVKRGLIYSAKIGDRKYYNKKSVELFREKDNGKYLLRSPKKPVRKYSLGNLIKVEFPTRTEDSIELKDQKLISAES